MLTSLVVDEVVPFAVVVEQRIVPEQCHHYSSYSLYLISICKQTSIDTTHMYSLHSHPLVLLLAIETFSFMMSALYARLSTHQCTLHRARQSLDQSLANV